MIQSLATTGDRRAYGLEELIVHANAAYAGQSAGVPGQPVGRLADQRVTTVLAADSYGHDRKNSDHDPAEEHGDGEYDYSFGHDDLQYIRPTEFLPQVTPLASRPGEVVPPT